jgi:hypothetical protein
MNNIDKVIAFAVSQIGVKEQPPGSNQTKYNEWCKVPRQPWCAMFVSYCFEKSGFPLPNIQDGYPSGGGYCPYFESYAKKNGQWHKTPKTGDLALFHFGKNLAVHIGIVEQVYGNTFTCIEGNTSLSSNDNGGNVMRRNRNINQCRGFYRPIFAPIKKGKDAYFRLIKLTKPLMEGNDISEWQKQMNYFKEYQGLEVDGYYGEKSEQICRDLQVKRGLEPDGIIGPVTWAESFKSLA